MDKRPIEHSPRPVEERILSQLVALNKRVALLNNVVLVLTVFMILAVFVFGYLMFVAPAPPPVVE